MGAFDIALNFVPFGKGATAIGSKLGLGRLVGPTASTVLKQNVVPAAVRNVAQTTLQKAAQWPISRAVSSGVGAAANSRLAQAVNGAVNKVANSRVVQAVEKTYEKFYYSKFNNWGKTVANPRLLGVAPRRTVDFVDDLDDISDRLYAIGGQSYGTERLAKLESYLSRRGVTLEVGSSSLAPGKAGSFIANADGTARLLLKADPSKQLVWHELGHFLQWKKFGSEAYRTLPRQFGNNVPEQFVFDLLERPSRWGRLSPGYRDHMEDYITNIWGGVGR